MHTNNVTDISGILNQRRAANELSRMVKSEGWNIGSSGLPDMDLSVYLLDSQNEAMVAFGCDISEVVDTGVQWGHLVDSWGILADPDLPSDDEHINVTTMIAQQVLSVQPGWKTVVESFNDSRKTHIHVLIIIDRDDHNKPLAIIHARHESIILDGETLRAIVKGYVMSDQSILLGSYD